MASFKKYTAKVDNTDVESTSDLQSASYKHSIEMRCEITYYRDGKTANSQNQNSY